jgi:transposase
MMKCGRPFEVEWEESVEELFEAYQQEKDVKRRIRLQALWLLRQGRSLAEASQTVGVSYRTLQRWVAWYRSGGLKEVLARTRGHGARGRSSYLTAEQQAQVKAQADSGAFRTAHDAAQWIQQQWGTQYTYKGIIGLFRRLQLRKRVPRPQSEPASAEEQAVWKSGDWEQP